MQIETRDDLTFATLLARGMPPLFQVMKVVVTRKYFVAACSLSKPLALVVTPAKMNAFY